ncbi:YciI family protein [Flexithrix dorotheae]|uniref:YciI family protein n=1 Tax=Flexithrix dorotheae TaxID=70993 RepID=UPI00035C6933|nr:YciI family protein [Flexithrix dorotheae]
MDFLVIAYDHTDEGALGRRLLARDAHLEVAKKLKEEGHFINGGAILDKNGKMIGSTLYMRFENKKELQKCLENDPYIKGDVWEKIEVKKIKLVNF